MLREVSTGEAGGNRGNQHTGGIDNNITNGRVTGTAKDYTLKRLCDDDPAPAGIVRETLII